MGIGSFIIELLAQVAFEPASLANSLSRKFKSAGLPSNLCAECKDMGEMLRDNENWYYYKCNRCQKKWVIPKTRPKRNKARRRNQERAKRH